MLLWCFISCAVGTGLPDCKSQMPSPRPAASPQLSKFRDTVVTFSRVCRQASAGHTLAAPQVPDPPVRRTRYMESDMRGPGCVPHNSSRLPTALLFPLSGLQGQSRSCQSPATYIRQPQPSSLPPFLHDHWTHHQTNNLLIEPQQAHQQTLLTASPPDPYLPLPRPAISPPTPSTTHHHTHQHPTHQPQPTPPPHTHKAHRLRNNRQHARPKTLATPSLPRPAAESAPPSPSQARVRVTDRDHHPTLEPTSYSLVPSPLVRPRQPPTVDGDGRPSITLRCRREAAAPQPARHIVSACSAPLRSYTPLSPLCATPPSIPPWSSSNSSLRGLLRHHLAPIRSVPSAIDTLGDEHQASLSNLLSLRRHRRASTLGGAPCTTTTSDRYTHLLITRFFHLFSLSIWGTR